MNKQISGNVGVVIAILAVIGILVGGYFMFLKSPDRVSPEDTKKMMEGAQMQQQMEKNYKGGGKMGGGPPFGAPPGR